MIEFRPTRVTWGIAVGVATKEQSLALGSCTLAHFIRKFLRRVRAAIEFGIAGFMELQTQMAKKDGTRLGVACLSRSTLF